jgi:hypothetical protein
MSIDDLKLLYGIGCLVLGLIILSPTLAMVISLPGGERFSELWILGPEHLAENYPFNIVEGRVYNISLGVANHMGKTEYYVVYVKVRNQTEPLPNSVNGTPSPLNPVFEYRVFLGNSEVWEKEISFSLKEFTFENGSCRVSKLVLGGNSIDIDKVAFWDAENRGFYFQIFFELWIYDSKVMGFQYHNRFVGLWLNATLTS